MDLPWKTVALSLLLVSPVAACDDGDSIGEGARDAALDGAGRGGSASGTRGSGGSPGSGGDGAAGGSGGSGGSVAGSSGDGGTGPDSGRCCPIDPMPGCCMRYGGSRERTGCGMVCDGMPWPSPLWRIENDEFGCPEWIEPPRIPGNCCGCLPIDSTPNDSAIDSGTE